MAQFRIFLVVLLSIALLLLHLGVHIASPCESSSSMDMKKPPRFGKRFQALKDASSPPFHQDYSQMLGKIPGIAHRSPRSNYQLLCIWPSMQRRNPPLIFRPEEMDSSGSQLSSEQLTDK